MLRSRTSQGNEIYSTICDEEETRRLSRLNELHCPNCENLVTYKNGPKTVAHFAHKPRTECVVTNYERETVEHMRGKDILYTWLTAKFKDAHVELEVYIPETEQIADVLVTHQSGDMDGQRWAFEFQHSPLSEAEWKRRHSLYENAGIIDFWIFDSDVFLQYSTAQDVEQARLFREPLKVVFQETWFTYFLEIPTQIMTVDCSFYVRKIEKRISAQGGRTVKNDYTFHDPPDHNEVLAQVEIHYDREERCAAFVFPKISRQFGQKFDHQIQEIKRRKHAQLVIKRRNRFEEIISFAAEKYSQKHAHVLKSFCLKNKSLVVDDLLVLEIPEFIEKYRTFVEQIIVYLEEFDLIRESDDLTDKVVVDRAPTYQYYEDLDEVRMGARFNPIGEIYDKEFIEKVDSFSYILYERYDKAIENVKYVMERHAEELEKLLSWRPKYVEDKLRSIDPQLYRWRQQEPSVLGYALGYAHCESREEIDVLVGRVKKEIIDYHPFRD